MRRIKAALPADPIVHATDGLNDVHSGGQRGQHHDICSNGDWVVARHVAATGTAAATLGVPGRRDRHWYIRENRLAADVSQLSL